MRIPIASAVTGIVLCFVFASGADAQNSTPQLIKIQGFLSDKSSGTPIPEENPVDLTFTLWDQDSEFDPALGTQLGAAVTVIADPEGGFYEVEVPFPASVFDRPDIWLQIKVTKGIVEETLLPRIRIGSAPYAYVAETLDGFDGIDLAKSTEIDTKIGSHAAVPDAHIAHAPLEESAEIITVVGFALNNHTDASLEPDPHDVYVHSSGDGMTGPLAFLPRFPMQTSESNRLEWTGGDGSQRYHVALRADGHLGFSPFLGAPDVLSLTQVGNVGIGTTSPSAKLSIDSVNTGETGFEVLSNGADTHIPFSDGEIYLTTDISPGATGTGDFNFRTYDGTGYTHPVVIKGDTGSVLVDGSVKIGQSQLSHKLAVASNLDPGAPGSDFLLAAVSRDFHILDLVYVPTLNQWSWRSLSPASPISFLLDGVEKARIDNSGLTTPVLTITGGVRYPDGSLQTSAAISKITVTTFSSTLQTNTSARIFATCPDTYTLTGGGFSQETSRIDPGRHIEVSRPATDGSDSWEVLATNATDHVYQVQAYAHCLRFE